MKNLIFPFLWILFVLPGGETFASQKPDSTLQNIPQQILKDQLVLNDSKTGIFNKKGKEQSTAKRSRFKKINPEKWARNSHKLGLFSLISFLASPLLILVIASMAAAGPGLLLASLILLYGLFAAIIIAAIMAISQGKKAMNAFEHSPDDYSEGIKKKAITGKGLGILTLTLFAFFTLIGLVMYSFDPIF